jgi:paraquat-inducible protein B
MTEHPIGGEPERELPFARIRRQLGLGWIWLVPLGALVVSGYLVYRLLAERGSEITIQFESAAGLVSGQTPVRYKAVTLGTVQSVELNEDLASVVVSVRMTRRARALLTQGAQFWVVRADPAGGLKAVQSGLETLVSGNYIAMEPGAPKAPQQRHFQGLEKPPSVRSDEPGTVYFLEGDALNGLSAGAPLYEHQVPIGELLSYELTDTGVRFRVFVRAPYDLRIVRETRFWNDSGLELKSGSNGLNVELPSLKSLFAGSIAVRTPHWAIHHERSAAETTFRLWAGEGLAELDLIRHPVACVSYFQSSLDGLGPGASVQLFGQQVGSVSEVSLAPDPRSTHRGELAARVAFLLDPERLSSGAAAATSRSEVTSALAPARFRAVIRGRSLITGQRQLSLEYRTKAERAPLAQEGTAWVMPGETQDIEDAAGLAASVLERLERVPYEDIGRNMNRALSAVGDTLGGPELKQAITRLNETLEQAKVLTTEARANLLPALARLPAISQDLELAMQQVRALTGRRGFGADSSTQYELVSALRQVAEAARSLRSLADLLGRHPEALLRGRSGESP